MEFVHLGVSILADCKAYLQFVLVKHRIIIFEEIQAEDPEFKEGVAHNPHLAHIARLDYIRLLGHEVLVPSNVEGKIREAVFILPLRAEASSDGFLHAVHSMLVSQIVDDLLSVVHWHQQERGA